MAAPLERFTEEQVNEIREALAGAFCQTKEGETGSGVAPEMPGLRQLLIALETAKISSIPRVDLDRMAAAVEMLHRPRDTIPAWPVSPSRGLFFVFEGLDRSGKSTQSRKLHQLLEKAGTAKWMCFPARSTTMGGLIDLYLRRLIELPDEVVHQLFSANRWELATSIVEDLNNGISVICDRYAFSGVAYSAAKGLDFEWCQAPDIGLPTPDGIFFLHIDETVGASRSGFGDERYENAELQAKVRQVFQQPALRAGVAWHDVNGARGIEDVHAEIAAAAMAIQQEEQENKSRPILPLWKSA